MCIVGIFRIQNNGEWLGLVRQNNVPKHCCKNGWEPLMRKKTTRTWKNLISKNANVLYLYFHSVIMRVVYFINKICIIFSCWQLMCIFWHDLSCIEYTEHYRYNCMSTITYKNFDHVQNEASPFPPIAQTPPAWVWKQIQNVRHKLHSKWRKSIVFFFFPIPADKKATQLT